MSEIVVPYLFAALMALEYGYNLVRGGRYQSPRDSATSLMVAIPHFAVLSVLPVAWIVLYRLVERAVPWHLPTAWWIWPIGIVVMDLASYWMHRYHHALNITWGIHSVHHSSDEFTMTTGARSSVAEPVVNVVSGAYLILVVPALVGLPVVVAGVGWLVKDLWGFAVHTRNVDKLGPLEWILATPSHHRVHHAINPIYDNKNYGFVTIIWDKLFGTFQPELASEPPIFGTHRPPLSFHPVAVAFHELRLVWRDAAATRRWRDKLRIWFMPAGWRPADVPDQPVQYRRHDSPPPRALYLVGGLQLVYLATASFQLSFTLDDHTVAANLAYLGFLVVATAVSGDFFERVPRYTAIETARALGVAVMVALTGTWFGRPLDAVSTILIVLAGANLVAAYAGYSRGMDDLPQDPDQAARELGRANRKPLYIGLGVIVAIVAGVFIYIKIGESAVRSALADKGYTDIKLDSTGMMSWKFEAKKGANTNCTGTVSRSPGSISTEESCITTETKKERTLREQIESAFSNDYGKDGFDTYTCPEVVDKQDKVECTVSAKNGAKATVEVTVTERHDDGSWAAWHTHHPFFTSSDEIKSKLTKEINDALVAKFPKATFELDCGSGAIAFDVDNKFSCKMTMHNPDKTPMLNLSYTDQGMSWKVDGL